MFKISSNDRAVEDVEARGSGGRVWACRVRVYVPSEPGGSGSSGCAETLALSAARGGPGRHARNDPDLRHRAEDGDSHQLLVSRMTNVTLLWLRNRASFQ